jgi:hypothetical protein
MTLVTEEARKAIETRLSSSVLETRRGEDTFNNVGVDVALADFVPTYTPPVSPGITRWEYGGVSNTWQVEGGASQQRTYRANASGGFGSIARTTNDLTSGTAGIRLNATLHRAGVDGSGETGYLLHNNGALANTVIDGLILTFQRVTASTVDTRLYTFVNGTKVDDVSLPTLAALSWTSSPEEEKAVALTYNHPTVTITVGAITAVATVTQDMTTNGHRIGLFSDAALSGSAGWRHNDVLITALTLGVPTTVAWPNRPFTVPTTVTACWVVAQPIGWTQGEGRSVGASTTRQGRLLGMMTMDICRRAGQGLGGLYTVVDVIRDLFVRAQLSVPASMSLTCYAPSGPGPVQIVDGVTIVRVKVPFEVWETIPN